jgi:hypothetical protein
MGLFYDRGTSGELRDPNGQKILVAIILEAILFGGAIGLESSHPAASDALLHAFEFLFAGLLALLGIETARAR